MKDELERYWTGYFASTQRAIRDGNAALSRMMDESLLRRHASDVLRQWRTEHRDPGGGRAARPQ